MTMERISNGLTQRIRSRDVLAAIFVVGYFLFLFYAAERGLDKLSDVMHLLLGILSSALILVAQFYYRKSPAKEKESGFT